MIWCQRRDLQFFMFFARQWFSALVAEDFFFKRKEPLIKDFHRRSFSGLCCILNRRMRMSERGKDTQVDQVLVKCRSCLGKTI